ncbi:MAG: biotin transporter BioY [bacterium]
MYKKLFKKIRYKRFIDNFPDLRFGSILVALFCTIFIIMATFTQIPLNETIQINSFSFTSPLNALIELTKLHSYIPQIPVILFLGALLGPRVGLISILSYLVCGLLGFPIFASGGGITYYSQQGFGYILGYFLGVFIVGNLLTKEITSLKIIRAAIIGSLAIHLTGIIYISVLMTLQHYSLYTIFGWISSLSGSQLPFDIIVSIVAISLARPLRAILWVALD